MIVHKSVCHPQYCDVMKHMTTRYYMGMYDDSSYHFLHSVFGWQANLFENAGSGWVDVKHIIDYKSEVLEGDLLEISATLQKLGNTSLNILYEMNNLSKNELASTMESTCVYFDLRARKSLQITKKMRVKAEKYLCK